MKRKPQGEHRERGQPQPKKSKTNPKADKRNIQSQPAEPRKWTVSIAIPGNIAETPPTFELKTLLAGHIARSLALFQIDEIIVYTEKHGATNKLVPSNIEPFNPSHYLARLFQYQECPQYLRKDIFPVHKDLKFAGLLNPLDTPHHMKKEDWSDFREGIVIPKTQKNVKGSFVKAGLFQVWIFWILIFWK